MDESRFPVGGSKEDVDDFMRSHGFVMGKWSDKHWTRADGVTDAKVSREARLEAEYDRIAMSP